MHRTVPPTFTAILIVAATVLALTIDRSHGPMQFALGALVGSVGAIIWERRATIPPKIREATVPLTIILFLWVAPTVLAAAISGDGQGAIVFTVGICVGGLATTIRPRYFRR